MEIVSREEAARRGYAVFNPGPHTIIDVPPGKSTISVKLPTGQRVTFAFAPYSENGTPRCVDIKVHDGGEFMQNGTRQIETMAAIVWTVGHPLFHTADCGTEKPTLVTVLLKDAA